MKRVLLLIALIITVFLTSCKKSDSSTSNSGSGNNSNSQEELYAWFIDNGWHEAIVQYGNTCEGVGGFYMDMDVSGNIVGLDDFQAPYYGRIETQCDYRLYSSLETVKGLTEAPTDGYTNIFVCENTKCGVTKKHEYHWNIQDSHTQDYLWYCKFYVERLDSSRVKVFFKEWLYFEEFTK